MDLQCVGERTKGCENCASNLSQCEFSLANLARQDHAIQLMLLARDNRRSLLAARADFSRRQPGLHNRGNQALQDYQMQLMLLEQQRKKRLLMALGGH